MNGSHFKNLLKKVLKKAGLFKSRNGRMNSVRNDVQIIPRQAGLELEVYGKS